MSQRPPRARKRAAQAVTIQQVAALANVSAMTVSHVLNRTKNVRDETRSTVLAAVETLGYVPNVAARELASAKTIRIGIVYRSAQNAFLSAMLVGSLNAAARVGAQVLLRKCDTFDTKDAMDAVEWLIRSGANALLLNPPYCETLSRAGLPTLVDVPISAIAQGSALTGIDCVGIDEEGAAAEMTRYLIERGHCRIGFVTGPPDQAATEGRLRGFLAACRASGIEPASELIRCGNFSFDSGLAAGDALLGLKQPPTAIFASNDDMAAGVSLVAHRRGLDVPRDIAIAGFDDAPIAVKIWPPMTTVRQEVEALAERGVEMLVDRHRQLRLDEIGEGRSQARAERALHRIVVREST